MEGVFLLHRRQIKELKKEFYVVLDPQDFHPRDRVDAIRTILEKPSAATPKRNPKRRGS
jgi:hypothetical protein